MDRQAMDDIADLLHRRSDLSTFLVHFTRDYEMASARENLLSILQARRLEARSVYGMMRQQAAGSGALDTVQRCVCLTETPLEHAWMMCRPIENRAHQFAPYGLAFPKVWARRKGANPVWYVDITPGHEWLTNPLNELVRLAEAGEARAYDVDPATGNEVLRQVPIEKSQIAQLAPFIEQMGTGNGERLYRKEFWWEREWRKVGALSFRWSDVVAVFAPLDDHVAVVEELRRPEVARTADVPPLLDPTWGLERMISAIRGVEAADAGPLPPRHELPSTSSSTN